MKNKSNVKKADIIRFSRLVFFRAQKFPPLLPTFILYQTTHALFSWINQNIMYDSHISFPTRDYILQCLY